MLEYWTFSKEDFPSVQIQVERADTWLGRFCASSCFNKQHSYVLYAICY